MPKNKSADVVRERRLRKSIFRRTRIVVLVFTLVLALSIADTLAFLTYSANQTPNRQVTGDVGIQIIENGNVISDASNAVNLGATGKKVQLRSNDVEIRVPELIRVSFVPEVQEKEDADTGLSRGNVLLDETWSNPIQDTDGNWVIQTDLITLYLLSNWYDSWFYKDGTFYYKKAVEKNTTTPELLQGAVWADDSIDKGDYGSIKINVYAEAIQATPAESAASWGCVVDDSGNVTMS